MPDRDPGSGPTTDPLAQIDAHLATLLRDQRAALEDLRRTAARK